VTGDNWLAIAILALVATAVWIIVRRPPTTPQDLEDTDW
jgi:LPXTG-motif cell wall-anchored protein